MKEPVFNLAGGEPVPELSNAELVDELMTIAYERDMDDDEDTAGLMYAAANAIIRLTETKGG